METFYHSTTVNSRKRLLFFSTLSLNIRYDNTNGALMQIAFIVALIHIHHILPLVFYVLRRYNL